MKKKTKHILRYSLIIIIVVLGVLLLLPFFVTSPKMTSEWYKKSGKWFGTFDTLVTLVDAVGFYEHDTGNTFDEEFIKHAKDKEISLEDFFEKLSEGKISLYYEYWTSYPNRSRGREPQLKLDIISSAEDYKNKYEKDSWGNKLNIDYVTNIFELPGDLSEYLKKNVMVIWSNGENGINERCLGDDVFWPIQLKDFAVEEDDFDEENNVWYIKNSLQKFYKHSKIYFNLGKNHQ